MDEEGYEKGEVIILESNMNKDLNDECGPTATIQIDDVINQK